MLETYKWMEEIVAREAKKDPTMARKEVRVDCATPFGEMEVREINPGDGDLLRMVIFTQEDEERALLIPAAHCSFMFSIVAPLPDEKKRISGFTPSPNLQRATN